MGVARINFAGLLVALSVALIGLAACGGGSKPSPAATATPATSPSAATGTPTAQSTSSAGQTPTLATVPDPLAQPVGKGKFELTLNGVTDPYAPSDELFAAEDGYRWVLIDVALTNVSADALDYGSIDFTVTDTNGDEYGASFAGQAQEFDAGTVQPSETIRGQLGFDVPVDAQLQSLAFDPDLDPDTRIEIPLP